MNKLKSIAASIILASALSVSASASVDCSQVCGPGCPTEVTTVSTDWEAIVFILACAPLVPAFGWYLAATM